MKWSQAPGNNLLIISNSFPNLDDSYIGGIFVKEQVGCLKKYFDNISVISPVAYGMDRLRKTTSTDYVYDDVRVFFPKYLNIPFFYTNIRSLWVSLETRAILSVIERECIPFDLIHAHMTWPSGAVAVELKKRFGVPVVITEHTSTTFNNAAKTKDVCWKRTLSATDAIIRVRKGDSHLFGEFDIPSEKIHVIPNGFDAEKFSSKSPLACRNSLGLPNNKKILLNVGNLYDPVKGHRYFIEAIGLIVRSRQDILGIIVGSGKLKADLQKYITDLHLDDYIRLVGNRPHLEIPVWINACDLFVLPSLNEGNPTVMFEALGCGKPFIGTRVGGVPEIIISETYGYLVDPADPSDLAEKILTGLDKGWNHEKILVYAQRFTWESIAKEIMIVYSQVSSG